MSKRKTSRKAQSIAAKLRRAARKRKDPIQALSASDLETLSKRAKQRAAKIRKQRHAKRREAAEGLVVLARRRRSLRGCRIILDIDEMGEVTVKIRQTVKRASDLPRPALALALFARAQAKRKHQRFSVTKTLDLIERSLGEPWPGSDTEAQRNSLKVAMSRLRDAPEALVVKLKTPMQIRRWAAKQGDEGFERAAEAMIEMLE